MNNVHKLNMNGIREVAKAYYNGAVEEEKKAAQKFFNNLDENGDGKVRPESFKRKAGPSFPYTEHNFRVLDENGDGTLDFDEVLALYYMSKVPITSCSVCGCMLLDSYFSCLRCQGKTSYSICCHCYGRRMFQHYHPSDEFADTRAQLTLLEQLMGQQQVARNRRDIFDQKSNGGSSELVKEVVFNAIDADGVVEQEVAMMNGIHENTEETENEEGIDVTDAVEALDQGNNIDVTDVVDALDQGIDILDSVVDVALTVASCSIM